MMIFTIMKKRMNAYMSNLCGLLFFSFAFFFLILIFILCSAEFLCCDVVFYKCLISIVESISTYFLK